MLLRSHFTRPSKLRQFSATPLSWDIQRPVVKREDAPEPRVTEGAPGDQETSSASNATPEPALRQSSSTSSDLDIAKTRIREWTKRTTISLRHRADHFTAKSKTTFSQFGAHLNQLTGYEEIEALKRGVVDQEERINACRQAARKAKKVYEEAVIQRADSQREVYDLLQRKTTWTTADVARFTELVPQDHHLQQEEARAKIVVDEAEDTVEREFSQLMRLILARYHEEQVWSDKIRSASTYGSLLALGLNMVVFISAILVVEPWKRRRLAQTFEDKILELSSENEKRLHNSMTLLGGQLAQQSELIHGLKEEHSKGLGASSRLSVTPNLNADDTDEGKVIGKHTTNGGIHGNPFSKNQVELAVVGAGFFVAGVISTVLVSR